MARRPLWMIVVLLLGAAATLWGATALDWGAGPGAEDRPTFTTLALLSLAGIAGVFAVSGWMRVLLGAILAATGGYVCWAALTASAGDGFDLLTGRGLALLGGVALMAAGVLVAVNARHLPTMGARYELAGVERRSGDPDKDMWDGLSEGEDPTVDRR